MNRSSNPARLGLRHVLFLISCLVAVVSFGRAPSTVGFIATMLFIFVVGNLLSRGKGELFATLTTTEILQDTLDAFKLMLPMLSSFTTDFSNARSKKGETIMAHVATLPAVQDYDATNGFQANPATADSLLTDVPVVLNQFKHVPIKVTYLTQLASRKDLYKEAVRNYAYVLAKYVLDYVLGLVTAANVTNQKIFSTANTSLDSVEAVRTQLNVQKAYPTGRFGLVNTAFAGALQSDTRVGSSLYYGQLNGGNGYRRFQNLGGFENIFEYPDLPANGINLAGFFGDRRSSIIASRLPNVQDMAAELNVPQVARFETIQDVMTGLSLLGIVWQQQGTFDVWVTAALLFGASVGAQGGAANGITDKACVRVTTS